MVSVTNVGFANQQQVNDQLLYVPLQAGISHNHGVQLLGSTLASVLLAWAYNKAITAQTVAGASRAVALRSLTLPSANLTSTTSYGLSATDGRGTANASTTVFFSNDRFWFVGPPGLTAPPAGAASDRPAGETRAIQFTLNAGVGEKLYYMRAARLGAGTYTVGGFVGGFAETTANYTNAAGFAEPFIIGESANTSLGLTTVTVS
jgi:hypothetical protein